MLPGRTYLPEDYVRMAWRRRRVIITPLVVLGLAAAVYGKLQPNRYQSESTIVVVPQRIPENYVRSTVTSRIEDRLETIKQQVLSRTRLEAIILDFDLYTEARRTQTMEEVVQRMRQSHIQTAILIGGDAFRVGYIAGDPKTAMQVTERLAALFIEDSLRDRRALAEDTNEFLEAQLNDAKRRLLEQEKKLEAYRRRFSGQLPSQVGSNLQALQNLQMQLQALAESANRDRDRRLVLEKVAAELNSPVARAAAPGPTGSEAEIASGDTAVEQLEAATKALQTMELVKKPDHPDVRQQRRVIRELEQKVEQEKRDPPARRPIGGPSAAESARLSRLKEAQTEVANLDQELVRKAAEERRLKQMIADYQARVEAAPTRESELVELTRDYSTLSESYTSLLAKKEDARIAASLERRQVGEQFRIVDPARLPERPFSPNRPRLTLLGALLGLAFGLGWAALLEYRDSSFRTDDDVHSTLGLPVLAMIPIILTEPERQRLRRRRIAVSVATVVATTILVAVAAAMLLDVPPFGGSLGPPAQ